MGTIQYMLIIVGVIVVGLAVSVSVTIFGTNMKQSNTDALINDCMRLASKAQTYYSKPSYLAGGNHSFADITISDCGWKSATNQNGTYEFTEIGSASFKIVANGNESNRVVVLVLPDSVALLSTE
ncbi:MAG: hypothetical protein GXO82_02970 [Chlorobi bacterium]|nr:hypothetical protein [Chlorobiota bacterium]